MSAPPERREELSRRLAAVHERISAACRAAGRAPAQITLIVVTKTWPAQDVRELAALGVRDVGENRDREAAGKQAECADLGLRWHFVGQVQSNKARSVAGYADVVHSVDRGRLVAALSAGAAEAGRSVRCLVQVDLGGGSVASGPRGGAAPADVPGLCARIAGAPHLELGGVMAVAPLGADPTAAFGELARIAAVVRDEYPGASDISAGMSGDLEAAVTAGATHLRVGTSVLGSRPRLG